ncbi:MAG: AAA family ATPase [Acidimicrobiia bacterium]
MMPTSVDELEHALVEAGYIPERGLSVSTHLAMQMGRPLFLEGEPGVGKTEVAKVLASITGGELIRLQCYEGLDASHALYEWDYARQMLAIRVSESRGDKVDVTDIMSEEFVTERPLLKALRSSSDNQAVLLIDELDRADEEFEAYLLEFLSDFQITIPEVGTIRATNPPIVVITSNRTREIHDAVKRRCIYHWIDYPSVDREIAILKEKSPDTPDALSTELAVAMERLRRLDLFKPPGVAETIDWAKAVEVLGATELSPDVVDDTIGVVLKYEEDVALVRSGSDASAP